MTKQASINWPEASDKDHGLHRVLIDFDGTLAEDTWPSPNIGVPIQKGVDILKHYAEEGYEVSIYTARPQSHHALIYKWLWRWGLNDLVYDILTDKPPAWLYVDDRSWNPWREDDA